MGAVSIDAKRVLFIKLGTKGSFEQSCIQNGVIELDYREIDHVSCMNGAWEAVQQQITATYQTPQGATTSHKNQIKRFYEEPSSTLWITFHDGKLWHCFADEKIELTPDQTKIRRAIGGWKDCDNEGRALFIQSLSGRLTKVQGYRGTICEVDESKYLLHKINNTQSIELKAVENDIASLRKNLEGLIRKLHPQDFEVFVDLIFRAAGWSRVGELGKTIKTIDIELRAPVTNERAVVQVKSQSNLATFREFEYRLSALQGYDKRFFVTHSPAPDLIKFIGANPKTNVQVWDIKHLSELSINAGLVDWIIKVAP